MVRNKVIGIMIFAVLAVSAPAQLKFIDNLRNAEEIGDDRFDEMAYSEALEAYLSAYKRQGSSEMLDRKIAKTYMELNQPDKALPFYKSIVEKHKSTQSEDLYSFAETLLSVGEYAEARRLFSEYEDENPQDFRTQSKIRAIDLMYTFEEKKDRIKVKKAIFNSKYSDFSPFLYGLELFFLSSRPSDRAIQPLSPYDGEYYLDVYSVDVVSSFVERLDLLNERYHEGPLYLHPNGDMFFTRTGSSSGKLQPNEFGLTQLKLYSADYDPVLDMLTQVKELPFNSDSYSVGHPTFNPVTQELFFVSNMPGGFGGTDIYKSIRNGNEWSEPINLGSRINTEGDELFPHIAETNHLYFASDGHGGLGGLDMFAVDLRENSGEIVKNLGLPVNSTFDDFGITFYPGMKKGFFSSNREGGGQNDDIYAFESEVDLFQNPIITGKIVDGQGRKPMDEVIVRLELDNNIIFRVVTEENGIFTFPVSRNENYTVTVEKEGYEPQSTNIITFPETVTQWDYDVELVPTFDFSFYADILDEKTFEPLEGVQVTLYDKQRQKRIPVLKSNALGIIEFPLDNHRLNDRLSYSLQLDKEGYLSKTLNFNYILLERGRIHLSDQINMNMHKIELGVDIGKLIDLEIIFFDLGKWDIRPDAAVELDKIVKIMKENPGIEIELGSHTDSRGDADSNKELSEKRARASTNYIISKGISASRIVSKGYGESVLVNNCVDGVPCTEKQHQENRRTEFKVTKFDN